MNRSLSPVQVHGQLVISLMLAALLEIYPLPLETGLWRPQWVLMTVFFWVQLRPEMYGLKTAFFAGLFLDVILGGVPGRNALALSICGYGMKQTSGRLNHLTVWHQLVLVFFLSWVFGGIVRVADTLVMTEFALGRNLFWSSLSTASFWLMLTFLLLYVGRGK